MTVRNAVQLITYPDSLGGSLKNLQKALDTWFPELFGGIHILPPFPSTGDRGFAPKTYFEIEPAFGTWEDISRLGEQYDILLDVMINHISRHSEYFQDFFLRGRASQYADMFITLDKIWPDGEPNPGDIAKIFLRRPEHCFETIQVQQSGETERVWATFGKHDWSEQIDLDVNSPQTRQLFCDILTFMARQHVNVLRLDAIAFVTKKAGTSCFFLEPQIYEFLAWIDQEARNRGIDLLPEVHAHYSIQHKLAEHGFFVYNFVLPLLILHALTARTSAILQSYLRTCPRNQITMLDCHDGIPVQPDINDVLPLSQAQRVVEHCIQQGANVSRIFSASHTAVQGFDAHQILCTYYSALQRSDVAYMTARAIQFFSPGIPQVYYVGLLAGENDHQAVAETGENRAINRHNFSMAEIETAAEKTVVKRLARLIRFRNDHPAFEGELEVQATDDDHLSLVWTLDNQYAALNVDLKNMRSEIEYSSQIGASAKYFP